MMRVSGVLSETASKGAAIAILAAVVWGVAASFAVPVLSHFRELNSRIEVQRQLLGRLRAEVEKTVSKTSQTGTDADDEQAAFLPGETDALRVASIQETLNVAASANKVRLASATSVGASEQAGVRLIGMQVQLSTEIEPLQKMLFTLETAKPFLVVDLLQISRAPEAAGANTLNIDLVLRGAVPLKPSKQE